MTRETSVGTLITPILVLDGVYSEDREDAPRFQPVSAPTERDEVRVSAHILGRLVALLRRRGLVDPDASSERAHVTVIRTASTVR